MAGAAVPTQRALVDAFLSGLLDASERPMPVHVTYLPSFDDVATAQAAARRMLGAGVPALFVSSSDGAGRAALALARAAGAPAGLVPGRAADRGRGAVVSDIPGILSGLVLRALGGERLPLGSPRRSAWARSPCSSARMPATGRAKPRPAGRRYARSTPLRRRHGRGYLGA